MKKIQDIVKGIEGVVWTKGLSHCYGDVTYSKRMKKKRFAFKGIEVKGDTRVVEQEIRNACVAEGHAVLQIFVHPSEISVYQEFPIEIVEK